MLERLLLCLVLLTRVCQGGFAQQGPKLIAKGAVGNANQGIAVALSAQGDTLAVGSSGDDNANGATWVFTRSGSDWVQQGDKLVGTDGGSPAKGFFQGFAVSLSADGNTLAVGGTQNSTGVGAVWVFARSGSSWRQMGDKLVGTGGVGDTQCQGYAVALSADGNSLAVGAPCDGNSTGATWVFARGSGGSWAQQGDKLVGTGGDSFTRQGHSVALSADGSVLAVGGPRFNYSQGAAWVFARSGNEYVQQGEKIIGQGGEVKPWQGAAVALSADASTLAVAGPQDKNLTGAVWVFSGSASGSVWTQQGEKLVGAGGAVDARQGGSIKLSADGAILAVMGAYDNDMMASVWVFTRAGSTYSLPGEKLVRTGATPNAARTPSQSVALSLDGGTLALGVPWDDGGTGATWVWQCSDCLKPSLSGILPPTSGTPEAPVSPSDDSSSSPGTAAIVGAVVAIALLCCVCVVLALFLLRKRRRRSEQEDKVSSLERVGGAVNGGYNLHTPSPQGMAATASGESAAVDSSSALGLCIPPPPYPMMEPSTMRLSHTIATISDEGKKEQGKASWPGTGDTGEPTSLRASSAVRSTRSSNTATGGPDPLEFLEQQLDAMHQNGQLLLGRFKLGGRRDRRVGGQGIVQFATHVHRDRQEYAVKLYLDHRSFAVERAQLMNRDLYHILPAVEDISDNADGSAMSLGQPLPPMVIVEKGESLDEFQKRYQADYASSMQIMLHLVKRVADLHAAGVVHRDLKPANVIYYPGRNEWTLIDLGGAAQIGAVAPLTCTVSYAAPETIRAMTRGEKVVVADPAVDVWALGVVAFELLSRSRVFETAGKQVVAETMEGKRALPWELPRDHAAQSKLRRLGWMREAILGMLERDPARRITLPEVLRKWRTFLQQTDPGNTTLML